jgi:hypothetical protein
MEDLEEAVIEKNAENLPIEDLTDPASLQDSLARSFLEIDFSKSGSDATAKAVFESLFEQTGQ